MQINSHSVDVISEECSYLFPKPRLDNDVTPKHLKAVFKMQIKVVVDRLHQFLMLQRVYVCYSQIPVCLWK